MDNIIAYIKNWVGTNKTRKAIAVLLLVAAGGGFLAFGRPETADVAFNAAKQIEVISADQALAIASPTTVK